MPMAMDSKGFVRFSKGSGAGSMARQVTIDDAQLKARVRVLKDRFGEAMLTAAEEVNALIAVRVEETAPRDTNRFVRGWLLACADVGPIPAFIPALTKSARHEQYLKFLEREYKRVIRLLRGLQNTLNLFYYSKPNRNRNTGAFRAMKAKERKLQKWADRLIEEYFKLEGDPTALLFDAERGKRNYSTVRVGVFGGRGRIVPESDRWVVVLHNLEPHTTIVEQRYDIIRRAMREVKSYHLSRVAAAVVRKIQKAA